MHLVGKLRKSTKHGKIRCNIPEVAGGMAINISSNRIAESVFNASENHGCRQLHFKSYFMQHMKLVH